MYLNWEVEERLNIHTVTLWGLSKYRLLLMARAASSVFCNHPPIWQVLRLSSLNLKRSNKSTFKNTRAHYASADFIAVASLYQTGCNIWNVEKKKQKHASCLSSQSDCSSVLHKASSIVNVLYLSTWTVNTGIWSQITLIDMTSAASSHFHQVEEIRLTRRRWRGWKRRGRTTRRGRRRRGAVHDV